MKYDDSQIGLEVDGKIWSGENYGFQSKESHDKLFIAGKLNPVQQGIDRFGNYLTTSAQADPIVGPVLNFIGAGVRTITNVTPEPIKQGVGFVLDKNQEAAENIAAATGLPVSLTDPMTIADVAMGGAVTATRPAVKTAVRETLEGAATIGRNLPPPGPQLVPVGAGAAPSVQLNVSGGKANLAPEVMPIITTKNPDVLSATNRKTGEEIIGSDLKQLKWQRKRTQNIQSQDNRIATFEQEKLELQNAGASPQGDSVNHKRLKRLSSYLDDAKAARNRYISNVVPFTDADPNWYKTGRGVWEKKIEQNKKYKHVKAALEQHHLVAKGATGAIFGKMDEFIAKGLADPDDLVLMYEYMRAKGVTPGDVKSNIENILKPAHTGKNRGLHRYLNESGAEFKQAKWDDILKAAEDPEDLMAILVDQVENNFVPNKEVGKIWQDLDDVLESL